MQAASTGQLLVSVVADRDDQILVTPHPVEVPWPLVRQPELMTVRCGDRTGVDLSGRMGAGRRRRDLAVLPPDRSGELGTRGIGGADEHHPVGDKNRAVRRCRKRLVVECQVAASTVGIGSAMCDESGCLQDPGVVGDQVAGHVQQGGEFGRRGIAQSQCVDDAQARGVRERRVDSRPSTQVVPITVAGTPN